MKLQKNNVKNKATINYTHTLITIEITYYVKKQTALSLRYEKLLMRKAKGFERSNTTHYSRRKYVQHI